MLYNPVYQMETFRRLMDGFLSDSTPWKERDEQANLYESEKGYMIQFQAPGVKKEDISVDLSNGIMTVQVKRAIQNPEFKDAKVIRSERSEYDMKRSYRLPDEADVEQIHAEVVNGLLLVLIPKKADANPRKITVKVA